MTCNGWIDLNFNINNCKYNADINVYKKKFCNRCLKINKQQIHLLNNNEIIKK